MAVSRGVDYVLAERMTYHGIKGIGKGCLLGTREAVLQLPVQTMEGSGRTMGTRDWFIEGRQVAEYVTEALSEPSLKSSDLTGLLHDLAGKLEGSELVDLSSAARLKVKSSFFSRGLYISRKHSGPGWRGFPMKKEDAAAFAEFYRGHPATVGV
jgi:hypothetical protein